MMGNYVDLIISVADTGMGIKDEDKDKLFQSFKSFYLIHRKKLIKNGN